MVHGADHCSLPHCDYLSELGVALNNPKDDKETLRMKWLQVSPGRAGLQRRRGLEPTNLGACISTVCIMQNGISPRLGE